MLEEKKIRLGLVVRADSGGLGSLSQDFYKYLEPDKTLIIYGANNNQPGLFGNGIVCEAGMPTLDQIQEFLKDLDVFITFETCYNWNLLSEAKKLGVKSIIIPNFEWTTNNPPLEPDLWLCPSLLDYNIFKDEGRNAKYLPIPIDRTKINFKLRTKARTFVFNNGHGGSIGRNSAREMIEAISRVKKDVKFIVRSQVPIDNMINDGKTQFVSGEVRREDLFNEGDVFVFPHKFDGLSLPIQEAMAAGMPIITTDFYPHNEYLPKELLFKDDGFGKAKLCEDCREIDMHYIYPRTLAEKIEEVAEMDLTPFSLLANKKAEEWSWNKMLPKYKEVIEELCQKK